MPATAGGPAQAAFGRLTARGAAAPRAGSALAGAAAIAVGIGPPARLAAVLGAATALLGWAALYAWWQLRRGWSGWLVGADIAVSTALCPAATALVPAGIVGDGSSGVFVAASATVVVSQLGPVPPTGTPALRAQARRQPVGWRAAATGTVPRNRPARLSP